MYDEKEGADDSNSRYTITVDMAVEGSETSALHLWTSYIIETLIEEDWN